jgi:hypothetical protein
MHGGVVLAATRPFFENAHKNLGTEYFKVMKHSRIALLIFSFAVVLALALTAAPGRADDEGSILKKLTNVSQVASTVPGNGDINPYGIVVVPRSVGNLHAGHLLISNFNNSGNAQGTGTTIVDIAPDGSSFSVFAQLDPNNLPGACPGGLGLTTALSVLQSGWVIVGSLPTSDGTSATAQAGCLIVIDSHGNPVETISGGPINGPWDMTAFDAGPFAQLFVTNVLNGTVAAKGDVVNGGTVVRIDLAVVPNHKPIVLSETIIASGFAEHTDPAALVIGPTGVALSKPCNIRDADDCAKGGVFPGERVLYVADTASNRIAVIPFPLIRGNSAGTGITLTSGGTLNGPLGLAVAPNGHVLTVNGVDGNIVETTPRGVQIASELIDNTGGPPPGNGTLFGLAFDGENKIYFVDDGSNTLNLLQ